MAAGASIVFPNISILIIGPSAETTCAAFFLTEVLHFLFNTVVSPHRVVGADRTMFGNNGIHCTSYTHMSFMANGADLNARRHRFRCLGEGGGGEYGGDHQGRQKQCENSLFHSKYPFYHYFLSPIVIISCKAADSNWIIRSISSQTRLLRPLPMPPPRSANLGRFPY